MNEKPDGPRHKREGSRIQAPWSDKGWYADEYAASRDPAVEKIVEEAGKGFLLPYGYRENRPGLAISPVSHNPYLNIPLIAVFIWGGFFLFFKMQAETLWLAIAALCFFLFVALLGIVMGALRAPGWHRARRAVKKHIAAHGGKMPQELRWYQ